MKLYTIIFSIFLFLLFSATNSIAQNFHKDGFDIDIMWEVRSKSFTIWGDFEKGQECDSIELYIRFLNKETGQRFSIKTITKNSHKPNSRSWFKDKKDGSLKKKKRSWKINDFKFECIKN